MLKHQKNAPFTGNHQQTHLTNIKYTETLSNVYKQLSNKLIALIMFNNLIIGNM